MIQMLYGKEQKGPVSALTQVNGYLVSAIGQKVQNILLFESAFSRLLMFLHSFNVQLTSIH